VTINPVNTLLAVATAALITYGLYHVCGEDLKIPIIVGSMTLLCSTLLPMICASFNRPRMGTNQRVVSGIFFVVAIGIGLSFSIANWSLVAYIIVNGLLLIVYTITSMSIHKNF